MTVRIVTWNVNGIRNPFKYSPWNKDKDLKSMFDILEADIVCFQEVKTPKASLTDDLVFVEGWDTFYSFPHSLTGYSGVAVYTRDSKCVPLRVEEGVTGVLKIPGTQTRYVDAPPDKQIGGYPTDRQLRRAAVGRDIIDSEGRCLILEFPLFVLINVYCPARRNHERSGYRNTFLLALDVRIRNLAAAGKNVVLLGDLNITRDQMDTAGIWGHQGHKVVAEALEFDENYMTMRAPKLLNQLLYHSRVFSDTGRPFIDETVETRRPPVLYDTCRELHPDRTGMFTCWDTRKNHRPANFGSRIDFIVCSPKVMQLVQEADIQPQLHGSDHCPVYIVLQDSIEDEAKHPGEEKVAHTLDYLNPPGRFAGGQKVLAADEDAALLKKRFPQSARRMAQFSNRRHIASMFQRAAKPPAVVAVESSLSAEQQQPARPEAQPSNPELPAIFKADPVELVESDDEGGAMIEDDDEVEDVDGVPGTAEEDERSEPAELTATWSKSTPATATQKRQPTDLPEERIDNDDRGSDSQPPPLHANRDDGQQSLSSAVSPSLPSRPGHAPDPNTATQTTVGSQSERGGVGGLYESSAVHGCRSQSPSTDLPFERGTTPAEIVTNMEKDSPSKADAKPNPIQSFWGDQSGVVASRERGKDGERQDGADTLGASVYNNPTSLAPKDKTPLTRSQSPTPSLLSNSVPTARRSLSRSRSGAVAPSSSTSGSGSSSTRPTKKAKISGSSSTGTQMSMNMFLTARPAKEPIKEETKAAEPSASQAQLPPPQSPSSEVKSALDEAATSATVTDEDAMWMTAEEVDAAFKNLDAAKASWSRLGLGQRQAPMCEHGEPCKTFVTKKAGVNNGRSFYMCARPPGPLGKREKGTAWQCTTFMWSRDWRPDRPE